MKSYHRFILHYTTSNGKKREYSCNICIQNNGGIHIVDDNIPYNTSYLMETYLNGFLMRHYMDVDPGAVYLHILGLEHVYIRGLWSTVRCYHRKSELLN